MSKPTKVTAVQQMQQMQSVILEKLETISSLNNEFKEKQERHFLKTFLHVMDRVSNELLFAQQQYKNIDKEIERDEKCVKLATELKFFREECVELRRQLNQTKEQLVREKKKNLSLQQTQGALHSSLIKKQKEAVKYRTKFFSFSEATDLEDFPYSRKESRKKRIVNPQVLNTLERKPESKDERPENKSTNVSPLKFKEILDDGKAKSKKNRTSLISTSQGVRKRRIYM